MSPHRFRVELRVGRTLIRYIEADTADIAQAIAEYVFTDSGNNRLPDEAESIIAITATAVDVEKAS